MPDAPPVVEDEPHKADLVPVEQENIFDKQKQPLAKSKDDTTAQADPAPTPSTSGSAADSGAAKADMTEVTPHGEKVPRQVIRMLIGPTGRKVYYVKGGTVVGDTFVRYSSKGTRAPDLNPKD